QPQPQDEPALTPTPEPSEPVGAGPGRRERAGVLREAGWSNKAIARELGVHASTVGRWAHRTSDPASQTLADAETKEEDKGEGV
ncbi:MAG: helix-turn-helix domain-containing protein, partial [Tomitella sp.]|nr:helix-turn-helix domain-containing protein [Tomitella sp.]